MLDDHPFFLAALLHPEHYENIEHYRPATTFSDAARRHLAAGWMLAPTGFWTQCDPPGYEPLVHGWKIHLSADPRRAVETLDRVVPLLVEGSVPFKFCSDPWLLRLSLSKNWSRAQAGKFITVYPSDPESFVALIERLHEVTRDLVGPYILTDRPYADSRVVFYRYGEHRGTARPGPYGFVTRGYRGPDGEWVDDDRQPYFRIPSWVEDPLSDKPLPKPPGSDGVLLHDRYRVQGALKFNAVGGIYAAVDTTTDERVVLREARARLGVDESGLDSFALLEKEARILAKLADTGLAPRLVETFREWEHLFLVQERLDAESLWGYSMNFYFDDELTPAESFRRLRDTIHKIAVGLEEIHRRGIILRDLTKSNVMLTLDDEVRFIDLEFAFEADRDEPPILAWTPGYASPDQLANQSPTPADDHYAFGVLILDMITYSASGYDLNRKGILAALRLALDDLGLPPELHDVVVGLTARDPAERWSLERALALLDSVPEPADDRPLMTTGYTMPQVAAPGDELRGELRATVDGLVAALDDAARYERRDRLWPAAAQVFSSSPVSLQFGAAGVASFLLAAEGEVDDRVLDWIEQRADVGMQPPGLMSGLAGTALLLLAAGRRQAAVDLFAASDRPDRIHEVPGIYYGAAGWGLAALHLWRATGDEHWLGRAGEVAERVVEAANEDADGLSWEGQGGIRLGFAEGQSGIATFLNFLAAASGEARWLEAGVKAFEFDLAHRKETPSGVAWQPRVGAEAGEPQSPHLWFGTAGVGLAAVRIWKATGDPEHRRFAELCGASVANRFTNKLWLDYGLSGFGELLLDLHAFTGEENPLHNAFHLAEALLPHRIPRERGIGFAGDELYRVCYDLGGGAAGIGLFVCRLLDPSRSRLLMLDELLGVGEPAAEAAAVAAATGGGG